MEAAHQTFSRVFEMFKINLQCVNIPFTTKEWFITFGEHEKRASPISDSAEFDQILE